MTFQYPAADFDTAGIRTHPGPITADDVADFLIEFLSGDALGILSTRHLALSSDLGPNHENSLRLAKSISEAVDFPKTGVLPVIPRGISLKAYPDFMEKQGFEVFVCNTALGMMYREMKDVFEIHLHTVNNIESKSILVDKTLLVPDHEKYLQQAAEDFRYYVSRMELILAMYNLATEYELITGCHLAAEEEKKNNDGVQTALLDFGSLFNEMRTRFHRDNLRYRKYGFSLPRISKSMI